MFSSAGSLVRGFLFIKFLRHSMTLDHVKFHRVLLAKAGDCWRTGHDNGGSQHPPYPDDCLKYKIERYITLAEANPFVYAETGAEIDMDNFAS
jgi:hypothetical protein